jgi:uncharacterized OB-fold protein
VSQVEADQEAERSTDSRPRPEPDAMTRFYWDAAADRRLVLQRCRSCQKLQYPPEVCCVHCPADVLDHVEVSGRGTIYSYAVVERPFHVGFIEALPYIVVLVELAEEPGLRMVANLVGVAPGTPLACGMPVEVTYEDRGSVTLPQFRLSAVAP